MTIITRKIKLNMVGEINQQKENWNKFFSIVNLNKKAANLLSSHLFVQDNIKDLVYLTEEVKVKLANHLKDPDGILNTSAQNSTYRLLSSKFKGDVPTSSLTSLNQQIRNTYNKEKSDIIKGEKSLRSYKNNIPIPISSSELLKMKLVEEINSEGKNYSFYTFLFFGIPFKTYFGKDKSNNRLIVERCLDGSYKLCNSSIQLKKNPQTKKHEIFLNLTVDIPQKPLCKEKGKSCIASLSPDFPMIVVCGKSKEEIGNKEEYTYRRLRIQDKLRKLQTDLKYNTGGRGRNSKLSAINRYHEYEKNYINTKLHLYSKLLLDFCEKNRCETLVLESVSKEIEAAKENTLVIRNWSYFNLLDKIKYKAEMLGINVIIS